MFKRSVPLRGAHRRMGAGIGRTMVLTMLLLGGQTLVRAADPVTLVQRPLMNRPVFVLAGQSFTVACQAATSGGSYQAKLVMPYYATGSLSVSLGNFANGVQSLSVTVPTDTPYELYDLVVTAPSGVDTVRHAVRVLSAFKSSFSFIHLPDCHLPAVSWVGFMTTTTPCPSSCRFWMRST